MEPDIYQQRLAALREENEFLRQAAHTFGELAERLADELRAVRKEAARENKNRQLRRGTGGLTSSSSAPR